MKIRCTLVATSVMALVAAVLFLVSCSGKNSSQTSEPSTHKNVESKNGGLDGGGGSSFAAEFTEFAYHAAKELQGIAKFPITSGQLLDAIRTTRVEFTTDKLEDATGHEVDAVNFPSKKLIRVNLDRWASNFIAGNYKLQLVVHEFLGIINIDDSGYHYSRQILDGGVPIETLVCSYEGSFLGAATITGKLVYYFLQGLKPGTLDDASQNPMTAYTRFKGVPNAPEIIDSAKVLPIINDGFNRGALATTWVAGITSLIAYFPLEKFASAKNLGWFNTKAFKLDLQEDGTPKLTEFSTMECNITSNQ